MSMTGLPNFHNARAVVIHRRDHNSRALAAQLGRIGLRVTTHPPSADLTAIGGDVILFDADVCHQNIFPWPAGEAPVPLIAVLGSEAPGPLERALAQAPSAFIQKPVGSTGVFNALVVAHYMFAQARAARAKLAELTERVRARPVVLRAALMLMREQGLSDTAAIAALRRHAMSERTTVEALAAQLVGMSSVQPMHLPTHEATAGQTRKLAVRNHGA